MASDWLNGAAKMAQRLTQNKKVAKKRGHKTIMGRGAGKSKLEDLGFHAHIEYILCDGSLAGERETEVMCHAHLRTVVARHRRPHMIFNGRIDRKMILFVEEWRLRSSRVEIWR